MTGMSRDSYNLVQRENGINTNPGVGPPPLLMNPHRSKFWFRIGVIAAIFDLCVMPVVYFYAFTYGTRLSMQDIFAVITGIFGLFCFIHYALRSLRLFMKKKLTLWGPLGWTRFGLLEFLHVNIAIIIFLIETELVIGTAPNNPIIRLCAMTSATASYYLGFLFILSSVLTSTRHPLPFNMSSTSKGSAWRPALYGIVEDWVAIEMKGQKPFRAQLAKRYEASGMFRRMIQVLNWCWGVGFLVIAIVTTVLVMLLPEAVVFGVGWGLPFLCCALMGIVTSLFVKPSLKREQEVWISKNPCEGSSITERYVP